MTQERLAEALSVSVGYISQIERGVTKINLDTLAAVAAHLNCELSELVTGEGWAACAVRKDGGDDPDVTDGALICARVERSAEPGIVIDGGQGVGRVTRCSSP